MALLRLTIEPIPANSRLASLLPRDQWDRLRRSIYWQARYRCQVCGRKAKLHCHEVWGYNNQTGVQWLRGFSALCPDCHAVKHIHFVRETALRHRLLGHFAAVNQISRAEAIAFLHAAAKRRHQLNQRHWVVNYGEYNLLMPCLADINQRKAFLKPPMGDRSAAISVDWL
jgi:hypothetical protein